MIGIVLLLAAAAPVASAPPSPPAPPTQAARGAAAMKALGMSDAGIAVLRKQGAPDPDARALVAKRQALRTQLSASAAASPFDVEAFAKLLRESSALEGTVRSRNEERIINTLKALPVLDRQIFAKAVFSAPPPPPSPGAVPPPSRP